MQSLTQKNSEINYFGTQKTSYKFLVQYYIKVIIATEKKSKCWHQKWKRDNHMIKMSCIKYQYWQIGTRVFYICICIYRYRQMRKQSRDTQGMTYQLPPNEIRFQYIVPEETSVSTQLHNRHANILPFVPTYADINLTI